MGAGEGKQDRNFGRSGGGRSGGGRSGERAVPREGGPAGGWSAQPKPRHPTRIEFSPANLDHTPHTPQGSNRLRDLCFSLRCTMMDDPSGRPPAGGVARWRRERRLRAQLRHEQQTVRMVLATVTSRWAPRTTAYGLRRQSPAPGRWRSEFRTPAYGHRRLLHRGCGRESCRIPRRRGVLGSTVASAMSSSWLSMSLCCRWWNSQWTLLVERGRQRRKRTTSS